MAPERPPKKKPKPAPQKGTRRCAREPILGRAKLVKRIEKALTMHGTVPAAFEAGLFPEYGSPNMVIYDLNRKHGIFLGAVRANLKIRQQMAEAAKARKGNVRDYSRNEFLALLGRPEVKALYLRIKLQRSSKQPPDSALLLRVSKLAGYRPRLICRLLGIDLKTFLRWTRQPWASAKFGMGARQARAKANEPTDKRLQRLKKMLEKPGKGKRVK